MLRRYYGKISFLDITEFVGRDGELVIDDLTGRVYVMDGITPGGQELGIGSGNVNLGNLSVIDQTIIPSNLNANVAILGNLALDHTFANSFMTKTGAGFDNGFSGYRFADIYEPDHVTGLVHSNFTQTLNLVHAGNTAVIMYANGLTSFPSAVGPNLVVKQSVFASLSPNGGYRFYEPGVGTYTSTALIHNNSLNQLQLVHENGVGLAINPNSSVVVDSGWTFADNKLTLPNNANIVYSNGVNILNSFTGNIDLEAVASNIIPATSNIYSLGSETHQWKDLWVSNSTIYISGIPLTVDTDIDLTFDGNKLVSYSGDNLTLQNFLEFPDSSIQETAYRFSASDNAPVLTTGAQWFNTNEGRLYINYNNAWVDANPTEIDPSALRADETGVVELPSGLSFAPLSNFAPVNGTAILQTPGEYINLATSGAGGSMSVGWIDNNSSPTDVAAITFNEFPGEVRIVTGTYGDVVHTWRFTNDGNVLIPENGNINYSNGVSILEGIIANSTYGNTEVTAYLLNNRIQTLNSVDFMYDGMFGTYPYMGLELTDQDTLSVRVNDSSGDYTGTAIEVNRISKETTFYGNVNITGNVVPTANLEYSLGSLDYQWKDLYVSNSTIYLGSVPLSIDNGSLLVNGNVVGGTYSDANVANYLSQNPQTGTYSDSNVSAYLISNPQQGLYGDGNVAAYISGAVTLGETSITDNTNSISTTTGALTVVGGVGIAQDVHVGGRLEITDTTESTSYDTGAVVINGGLGVNGNINLTGNINILNGNINIITFTGSTGNFYGDPITGFNAIYAGKTGFTPLPYTVGQFSTNSNSYSQINMENLSSGKLATADYVGTADIGDDASWFFDVGIAGSGYDPVLAAQNNALGTSIGPLDAYYYVQGNIDTPDVGGNLTIGTSQDNKVIKFIAGGVNEANIVLTISQSSVVSTQPFYANNLAYSSDITNLQNALDAANLEIATKTTYSDGNVAAYLLAYPQGSTYSNSNVESYLTSQNITSYSNSNVASYLLANPPVGTYSNSNVASYLLANPPVGTYSNSNVASYLLANPPVGTYSNSNVASYLASQNITSYSNSNVASYLAANPQTGTYSNSNVASYLLGNVTVGNIVVNGGNISTTSNTAYVFNATPTTVYLAGNATVATYIGNQSGLTELYGNVQGSTNGFAIGYRDIPQVTLNANATLALTDAGKHYYATSGSYVVTVPSNANVAFPIGAAINIVNQSTSTMTISPQASVNIYLAGNSTASSRTLATYGVATLQKVATNTWFVVGVGLS